MNSSLSKKQKTRISRYLALILRHKPEEAGIQLDPHGWTDVEKLLQAISEKYPLDRPLLEEIVRDDEKQRYAFNADHTKIRASQGHSVPVDVQPEKAVPPPVLYHGTGEKSVASILSQGLLPRSRLYVHLSGDIPTARKVGSRHGKPVVLEVDTEAMSRDGREFFLSENGIWLCREVPAKYLKIVESSDRKAEVSEKVF